jgi:dTDP-3-amino-3,4,6-trideoxy-alpha-D-glucose transaminase
MPGLVAAFERVVDHNSFILGEELEAFEGEFADYCGTAQCVGVSSGTAALTLALRAAGIGPGDEVIVPAHTYVATAYAVELAGASAVFADVEDSTGLLSPEAVEAAIGESTAAVIPVHLYGQACDIERFAVLAKRHGLFLLEDAAQAHGAQRNGRRVGSLGAAGAFSFYPSKNLGALGDGGAIVTDDSELADRARTLRNLGQARKGEHLDVAGNERLDGLQAAFLREKLANLDEWNAQRARHAKRYLDLLDDAVGTLGEVGDCVFHLFPVRLSDRDAIADGLRERGIDTGVHYFPTAAWQAPFRSRAEEYPAADRWQREVLSLPMFPELEPDQIERVAGELVELVGRSTSIRPTGA